MLDPGVHHCALARWWGGEVKQVWARLDYPASVDREVEDSAEAILDFGTGVFGHIAVNWRSGAIAFRYEIQGREGVLLFDNYWGAQPARLRLVDSESSQEFSVPDCHSSPQSYQQEWDDFLTSIIEGKQPEYPGEQGLLDVAVVAAAYASHQTGTWVEV